MRLSHVSRLGSVALLATVLGALPACGSGTGEPAQSAQTGLVGAGVGATTRAPLTAAAQAKGPEKLFADAFAEVPLNADQRTAVEQLFVDAEGRHAPVRKARADATVALAAQIESGTVDRAALGPKFDAIAAEADKAGVGDHAAFEKAHALLTPEQRVAFANAVQAKLAEKHEGHEGHGQHMAMGMGGMKKWAEELQLSEQQRTTIKDGMRARVAANVTHDVAEVAAAGPNATQETVAREVMKHRGGEMKAQMDKILEAFKTDHFVMSELAPANAQARAHDMGGHMLNLAEVAVPVLTVDQRALAAKKIRAQAAD